jgi:hypothetical protein
LNSIHSTGWNTVATWPHLDAKGQLNVTKRAQVLRNGLLVSAEFHRSREQMSVSLFLPHRILLFPLAKVTKVPASYYFRLKKQDHKVKCCAFFGQV